MPAYKDETRNNWYCAFYFEDWNGERKKKMKRGFETKKAAQDWERQFLLQRAADTDMRFDKFVEQYIADRKDRLRENTWLTKEHIINTKILPYFKDRKLREIQARDVIAWQNELMSAKDDRGKPYSSTYLKTVHNQLSAIFNHAVKYYNLRTNPAQAAGNMGSEKRQEMLFWTREEYAKFAVAMMDKPRSSLTQGKIRHVKHIAPATCLTGVLDGDFAPHTLEFASTGRCSVGSLRSQHG